MQRFESNSIDYLIDFFIEPNMEICGKLKYGKTIDFTANPMVEMYPISEKRTSIIKINLYL